MLAPLTDPAVTDAFYLSVARYATQVSRRFIEGAGHWVQRSHPDEVVAVVREFVLANPAGVQLAAAAVAAAGEVA